MRLSSKPLVLFSCLALLWLLLIPAQLLASDVGGALTFDDPTNDNPVPTAPKATTQVGLPAAAPSLRPPDDVIGRIEAERRPFQHRHPAFTGESRAPPSL